ncbi:hypothetical protein [Thiospirochaeta perfilievii]|uniref:hypothetical protein n=1 Tax=Thiospirochaeta perfilievii TaxID=252967 RepID=UPI001659AC96|nr:hypothetical protein [Thiospirochaeta perfilievii]
MAKLSIKNTGFEITPIVLLYGVILSVINLKFYFFLIFLAFLMFSYKCMQIKFGTPKNIFLPLLLFFINGIFVFILNPKNANSLYHLGILFFSFTLIIAMYFYGYNNDLSKLINLF